MELLFLSFTTLSATGLSDVTPIGAHARGLVMIEQLAGLAYVAMIVSWMVGLTVTRSRHFQRFGGTSLTTRSRRSDARSGTSRRR